MTPLPPLDGEGASRSEAGGVIDRFNASRWTLNGECRLARRAQAFGQWGRRVFLWVSLKALPCAAAGLALAGCGAKGVTLDDIAIDRSIVTGSVSPAPPIRADPATSSDEATIRNAVSSAIVEEIGVDGIGWANAYTGSRGTIRNVSETREGGVLCRSFTASRESFDGVHMFRGAACLGAARLWVMKAFERFE